MGLISFHKAMDKIDLLHCFQKFSEIVVGGVIRFFFGAVARLSVGVLSDSQRSDILPIHVCAHENPSRAALDEAFQIYMTYESFSLIKSVIKLIVVITTYCVRPVIMPICSDQP